MLFFTNITKFFGPQILLQEANFQINTKERVGLIGRNGAGKSTLSHLIDHPDFLDDGEISYPDHYKIGKLDQNLTFTKDSIVKEVCQLLPKDQRHELWRAEKLLSGLGFTTPDFKKTSHVFSGGYQMRIKLAQLLLSEPDLLLLDEPTNYLDILSIRWLESFLRKWKSELLCISHDHDFLHRICTHTAIIHRQKIKKIKGTPEKLYNQIEKEEEIHEKTRKNDEKEQGRQEKFIREFRSGARSAGLVQSRIKMLEKKGRLNVLPKIPEIRFTFPEYKFNGSKIGEIKNLSFGYTPGSDLFQGFSGIIQPGDKIGIIGANGKGKSTLLQLLAHQLKPQNGTLKIHGNVQQGYFGQSHIERLSPQKTILEELACQGQLSEQQARSIAGNLLFSGGLAFKKIEILSGGEKARVHFGKLLAIPSNLLLLDEPTNHLDYESIEALIKALEKYKQTVLFVTHNEQFLKKIAKKLIVFDNDEVFFYNGTYEHFLENKGFANEQIEEDKKDIKPKKGEKSREEKKEIERLIRPLKRKIERCEKQITELETQKEKASTNLTQANRQGSLLAQEKYQIDVYELEIQIINVFEEAEKIEKEILEIQK